MELLGMVWFFMFSELLLFAVSLGWKDKFVPFVQSTKMGTRLTRATGQLLQRLWLTCIEELRLGATAVDDHRLTLLLRHSHAQRRHGAFVNKALKTGHAQEPATHTVLFHKQHYRMGGRKQIHPALGSFKHKYQACCIKVSLFAELFFTC